MVPPVELETSPLSFLARACKTLKHTANMRTRPDDETSPEWLWLHLINSAASPVARTDFAPMLIQQLCDATTGRHLGFYRIRLRDGSVYFTCDTAKGESVPRKATEAVRQAIRASNTGLDCAFWPTDWDQLLTRSGVMFAPWGECAPRVTQTWEEATQDMTRCA